MTRRKRFFRFACMVMLLAYPHGGFCQPTLRFSRYTTSNGLSSNTITCILQDQRGFMWFGTQDGLNRFDGRSFLIYKNNPSDPSSISGNVINCLAEDSGGLIWIGTADGGLSSYNYRSNRFTSFTSVPNAYHYSSKNITSLAVDPEQKIWLGLDKGAVCYFDQKTRKFTQFIDSAGGPWGTVYAITVDKKGTIFMSPVGLELYWLDHGKLNHLMDPTSDFPYPAYTISTIFCDHKNEIWCGGWDNALYHFDRETLQFGQHLFETGKPFSFSGNELLSINEDAHDLLWLGTKTDGLYLFDPSGNTSYHYPVEKLNPYGLKGNRVYSIYRDRSNRMWLGTDAGVHLYDPLLNQFEVVDLQKYFSTGSNNMKVNDFFEDDNKTLFVATNEGLLVKEKNEKDFRLKTFTYKNQSLSITKIFRDGRKTMYLGTQKTLFVFNPKDYSIKPVTAFYTNLAYFDFFDIGSSRVNSIAEAEMFGDTVLWVSVYGHGVCLFDRNTMTGTIMGIVAKEIQQNLVRKVFVDSHGQVWMPGATGGLITGITNRSFTDTDNLWRSFPHLADRILSPIREFDAVIPKGSTPQYSLRSNDGYDMLENKDGTFWLTTFGGGLYYFNPGDHEKTFTHFDSEHQDLEGIAKDNNGNLWIIAAGGMDFFDVREKTFFRYDQLYGIPDEGLSGFFYKDAEGYLYAGGNGFYIRFKPENVQRNKMSPPVFITHLKVLDQPADSLLLKKVIHLRYDQNFLSFELAALNFTNPLASQFSYQLQGFDKDWAQKRFSNQVSYTNIPPGDYVFKVKASNNDGVWNEEGNSLRIIIYPPWWRTWWFYVLVVVTVAAVLYAIYRYRVNQLLHLQSIRNKIARDLHDDIGSTLGSISFFSEAARQQLDQQNTEASKKVIEKIGENSRMMIETMSDIVWSVNPENDSFAKLILRMQAFASDVLSSQNIRLQFHAEEKLRKVKLNMEQRKNIFLIFKEAIHNIVKYATCTEVEIEMKEMGRKIFMLISDNGKGFDLKDVRSYNGNGLKSMKARANEIEASIEIESTEKSGTTIRLILNRT